MKLVFLINGATDSCAFVTEICAADKKARPAYLSFKKAECCFFSLSGHLSIERAQKAAAAANIIYLGGRICTLCQWTAPGLLCASIHYRHKALDVSPLHLFCALSARHTSSVPSITGRRRRVQPREMGRNVNAGGRKVDKQAESAVRNLGSESERFLGNPSSILQSVQV